MSEIIEGRPDGRFAIRFERVIRHRREKVWDALTETDQLRRWFVEILDYDASTLDFGPQKSLIYVASGQVVGHGTVTRCEPPTLLEYTWDTEVLRWELAEALGGCRLIFTNIVDRRETAEAVSGGWSTALDALVALIGQDDDVHA